MKLPPLLSIIALCSAVLPGTAPAQDLDHDTHEESPAPLTPETFEWTEAVTHVSAGDGKELRTSVQLEELKDWSGYRIRVTITNDGSRPVEINGVDLMDDARGRTWISSSDLRVLTFEAENGIASVSPLHSTHQSEWILFAAANNSQFAVIAGFPSLPHGTTGHIRIRRDLHGFRLTAGVQFESKQLLSGESFVTPELIVLFAHNGLPALEWLLDLISEGAVRDDEPPGFEDALRTGWSPLGTARMEDGRLVPAPHPFGRPLDLLHTAGPPRIWRNGQSVTLLNPLTEPAILRVPLHGLGLEQRMPARTTLRDDGRKGGLHVGEIPVVLPPFATQSFTITAEEDSMTRGSSWNLTLVEPPAPDTPPLLSHPEVNEPELMDRLNRVLDRSGVVIANLAPGWHTEPLPAAVADLVAPTIVPYLPGALESPTGGGESRFLKRASNVEWALDFPAKMPEESAWLLCPEAGFDATPLAGALVDGIPAGRGFVIASSPGLVIVTSGLTDEEVDLLARSLLDPEVRTQVIRGTGSAMKAVHLEQESSGIFTHLPHQRLTGLELIPGSPFSITYWSALIADAEKTVRRMSVPDGSTTQEVVVSTARPVTFALDIPPRFEDDVAVVIRRASSPYLKGYRLEIDNRVVDVVECTDEKTDSWKEDVLLFGPDTIHGRTRLALYLIPEGGVLPLARIGFFRVERKNGLPLTNLSPQNTGETEGAVLFHEDRGKQILLLGNEAYLDGIEFRGSSSVEYDLGGEYQAFLARCGFLDPGDPACRANLTVLLDDQVVFEGEISPASETPIPLTLGVEGGRKLVLAVSIQGPCTVALVDGRLIGD